MRILLPPSEAKQPGGRGRPLGRRSRTRQLDRDADVVLAALARLLEQPEAAEKLKLPASVAEAALAANAAVLTGPTRPAIERYCGVVYEGLAVAALSPAARRRADRDVLIFSGLFGVVRGGDPVPDYRLPAKAVLPGIGVAGTYWRPRLTEQLPSLLGPEPILDLRSADYAAMWQPARGSAEAGRRIVVRILSATPSGRLAVVSYNSKLAKGRLAAAVLEREAGGTPVRTGEDIAELWRQLGGTSATAAGPAVELIE